VAGAGVFGILIIHTGLTQLGRVNLGTEPSRDEAILDLLVLREHLQRLLTLEGAILGVGVLAAAALRNAVLAAEPALDFPKELVLIQGAGFSMFIALIWAPTYGRLVTVAARLRDSAVGSRAEGETWADWHKRRQGFDEFVGLGSATASFRSGVAIFTPLASSLVGLLLG
jgi:hypothetical protein